jgi:cytosine/adenosine deaminase-related metal-dependent hydrolase
MVRVAVAPCSPFSVSGKLLEQAAALARREASACTPTSRRRPTRTTSAASASGASPTEYVESLGWLGPDVWMAHAVHLDDAAVERFAATGTSVAHCPSSNARLGAGIARVRDLRDAGVAVGLGVDGAASNEASSLVEELRHAVLFARARGGPTALSRPRGPGDGDDGRRTGARP